MIIPNPNITPNIPLNTRPCIINSTPTQTNPISNIQQNRNEPIIDRMYNAKGNLALMTPNNFLNSDRKLDVLFHFLYSSASFSATSEIVPPNAVSISKYNFDVQSNLVDSNDDTTLTVS